MKNRKDTYAEFQEKAQEYATKVAYHSFLRLDNPSGFRTEH